MDEFGIDFTPCGDTLSRMTLVRSRRFAQPIIVLGASSALIGCAALLGLEDGTESAPLTPDGSAVADGSLEDATSTADSGSDSTLPSGRPIQGVALDSHGLPLTGATIRVRPSGVTTDGSTSGDTTVTSEGKFSTTADLTYDLYLGVGSGSSRTVFVYVGLTTSSLRLQVPYFDAATRRSLAMNGLFPGAGSFINKPASWCLSAGSSQSWGSATLTNATNPEYEISNGSTFAPTGTSSVLRILASNNALGNAPYYFGQSPTFRLSAPATNTDLAMNTAPSQGTLSAAITSTTTTSGEPVVTGVDIRKQVVFASGIG